MASLFEYLTANGDRHLRQFPFNSADNVLLCLLFALPFERVLGERERQPFPLAAAELLRHQAEWPRFFNHYEDARLLYLAASSARFGGMAVERCVSVTSPREEIQFAAMTCALDDGSDFVVFRGTDDSFAAWKEDLNMCFLSPLPAQLRAVAYLNGAPRDRPMRLGGHSKGGNLAVYAAAFCDGEIRQNIVEVYNNDGPGFSRELMRGAAYQAVRDRIRTYVPQSSIVGMLFEHEENYEVVRCRGAGFFQHILHNWQVGPLGLLTTDRVSGSSRYVSGTLRSWIENSTAQEREALIDALYDILLRVNVETLSQFGENWTGNILALFNSISESDPRIRRMVWEALVSLGRAAAQNLPSPARLGPILGRRHREGPEGGEPERGEPPLPGVRL
ncbi:MAG: DUF2974 domain-containing protein [Clostridiales bacterium]|nr:DUF2974 domain-containing protein [Clostridiales bacterium]